GKKNIHVQFRHSESIGANAFALPDGSIVFTDDLVRLSDTDGELIAVLLHEIGHLHHRHSLRMAIQGFSLAAFVAIITGDVSTSSTIITGLPALLIQSGYSREMETEADDYSLDYMLNNNISPGNFASILSRIEYSHSIDYERCIQDEKSVQACLQEMGPETSLNEEKSYSVQDFLSSHPGTSDRIHRFQHL
ncbi:MAG TPA: M48 family metallopeptidase, partial [Gammaproteobacteria bacterium]|nr:M48 family metallopeptidase [Gammaproteobacteria bacterium]